MSKKIKNAPVKRAKLRWSKQKMTQPSVVRVDAKSWTNVVNKNPSSYTYKFRRPLRDVSEISLTRLHIPRSQIVTLIRVSDWILSANGVEVLADTSEFHQMAVRMETAIGGQPATSNYVATITNPAATVDLRVHDVYTRIAVRDNFDYKTYDVLICTGTVLTTASDDWTITAEGELPNTEITPTADAGAVLTVNITPQAAVLRIKLNGTAGVGRIEEASGLNESWMSYKMYYPGDVVLAGNGNTRYACNAKHLSVVFEDDLAAQVWSPVTDATATSSTWSTQSYYSVPSQTTPAAADAAFEVFYFDSDSQTITTTAFSQGDVQYKVNVPSLQDISIEWVQTNGQPFVFPYTPHIRVTSLESNDAYTFERVFASPCIQIQIIHRAYWQQ